MRIYIELKALNVPLYIDSLVVVDGKFDEDRFRALTRPRKAATGLRYVRLVEMYIAWHNDQIDDPTVKSAPPTSKENFWKFLHSLVEREVGRLAPKSAIYALEFFAEGLGFDNEACSWVCCRRLGSAHAVATKPTNHAATLPIPLLSYLEEAVLDENAPKPVRVFLGRLRLCVQASLRWDDLVRTPAGSLEWIRRKGETGVVGLRSKAALSKTGVRPWVASYLGTRAEHDHWLFVWVELLLECHGPAWESHDHVGKSYDSELLHFRQEVPESGQDLAACRSLFLKQLENEREIGFSNRHVPT